MDVRVLDVHEYTINTEHADFEKYKGKTITIIHLHHYGWERQEATKIRLNIEGYNNRL